MKKLILIYQREDNFGCAGWDIIIPFSHSSVAKATKELNAAYKNYKEQHNKYLNSDGDMLCPSPNFVLGNIELILYELDDDNGEFQILTLREFWDKHNQGYKVKNEL